MQKLGGNRNTTGLEVRGLSLPSCLSLWKLFSLWTLFFFTWKVPMERDWPSIKKVNSGPKGYADITNNHSTPSCQVQIGLQNPAQSSTHPPGLQRVAHWPISAASPGSLTKLQNLRLRSRPTESDSAFNKICRCLHLKVWLLWAISSTEQSWHSWQNPYVIFSPAYLLGDWI